MVAGAAGLPPACRPAHEEVVLAPILQVENLKTHFFTPAGVVRAVDGVSFEIERGEIVGIVGESGSGKSMTALSILRLVPEPGRIVGGRVLFGQDDRRLDVAQLSENELRELRGNEMAMIFQDPVTSLNPLLRIGYQVREAIDAHSRFAGAHVRERVITMLERVHIPGARLRANDYPHQFSRGMRQRAMIAMGLSNEPSLMIADEPTAALDVTVQAQIIELLRDLNRELDTAILVITHNLAVVASLCTRVIVMYAGRIVEQGPTRQVLKSPQHPYTWSLLRSIPRVDESGVSSVRSIAGLPPDLTRLPPGCKFHPRCRFRIERCVHDEPPLETVAGAQQARCWVPMRQALGGEDGDRT